MKIYIIIILIFNYFFGFCQVNKIDSLFIKLQNTKVDSSRLTIFNLLANEYRSNGNFDSTILMANQALTLSLKLNNEKGKANAHATLGAAFYSKALYPQALHHNFLSLKLKQNLNDKKGEAALYNNIGNVYRDIENYQEAIEYFNKSINIKKKIKDEKGIATSYINIGNVYAKQRKNNEALNFYQKSLIIKTKLNDLKGVSILYNNLGIINNEQGLHERAKKHFVKADSFFYEAIIKYQNSLQIKEKLGDKTGLANLYCNLGNTYCYLNKPKNAESYFNKSLELSNKVSSLENLKNVYFALSMLDSMNANYKSAYNNYKKYVNYKDSITNEENTKKSVQEKIQYEFDLKEKEAKLVQEKKDVIALEEKQKQFMFLMFASAGLLIVSLLAFFIFKGLKVQKKANVIISKQKEEVDKQKAIIEEHQKETIDSINYAKKIQYALLANDDLLKHNLPNHFVLFNPKDIVSGDFYWATEHNNKFYLAVCDSTGHGVPGAFMSLLNMGFLSEAVKEKNIEEPHEIFNYVRLRLINSISSEQQKDGMDGILLCIDKTTNQITYSAANNEPILVSNNKVIELPKDKMPVGKGEKNESFTLHQVTASKGDVLYLYTDGYADQFGGLKGKKFKYRQLNDLLLNNCHEDLNQQKVILLSAFTNWKGNLEQVDDVLIVGIKI